MAKAGIAVDDWKLPILERHLKQSGYTWSNRGHLAAGVTALTVDTENLLALAEVVKAAMRECAATGVPQ